MCCDLPSQCITAARSGPRCMRDRVLQTGGSRGQALLSQAKYGDEVRLQLGNSLSSDCPSPGCSSSLQAGPPGPFPSGVFFGSLSLETCWYARASYNVRKVGLGRSKDLTTFSGLGFCGCKTGWGGGTEGSGSCPASPCSQLLLSA